MYHILTKEFLVESLVDIILILILVFLLSRVVSSIINGRYLLGSLVLPIKRLIFPLQVLEQANPNAFIKINFRNTFDRITIYKRQDERTWWFECFIPLKNLRFMLNIWAVKEMHDNIKFASGTIPSTEEYGIYLGSNIENISEIVFQYLNKVNKYKRQSKVHIIFCKTRVEESTIKNIIEN